MHGICLNDWNKVYEWLPISLIRLAVQQVLQTSEKSFCFQSSLDFESMTQGLQICVMIIVEDVTSLPGIKNRLSVCFL